MHIKYLSFNFFFNIPAPPAFTKWGQTNLPKKRGPSNDTRPKNPNCQTETRLESTSWLSLKVIVAHAWFRLWKYRKFGLLCGLVAQEGAPTMGLDYTLESFSLVDRLACRVQKLDFKSIKQKIEHPCTTLGKQTHHWDGELSHESETSYLLLL